MKMSLSLFRWIILAAVILMVPVQSVLAAGGTNRVFGRMDTMIQQMEDSGQMSAEDAKTWREDVKTLRDKVDDRIKEQGGLNNARDKDLIEEIDSYNKPLFDLYQSSRQSAR